LKLTDTLTKTSFSFLKPGLYLAKKAKPLAMAPPLCLVLRLMFTFLGERFIIILLIFV
jgi:hypothetical protein